MCEVRSRKNGQEHKKKYSGQQQKEMDCDEPHTAPNEKTQGIQWTERPTGALVAAGSLWPKQNCVSQFVPLLLAQLKNGRDRSQAYEFLAANEVSQHASKVPNYFWNMLRTHWELLWEHIENQKTSKNPTRSPKEKHLLTATTLVSHFTNFINVYGNELSPSATIQDMECSNLLVCVNE